MDPCGQGIWEPFLSSIAPDVIWWIASEEQDPSVPTGVYNFAEWKQAVNVRVFGRLKDGHQDMKVLDIDVVGQKAFVEAEGKATQLNGRPYNNRFCWILFFDEESKKIVKIREYIHTALTKEVLSTNAGP
ncbi:hypothetical protein BP5796_09043 [Coleophoma crateriformis]|uniref:SnoaL-like domain-containing protein n=1 Tax=Coleophoma crateriformis TaxID=565419 RepID=A0A3D8R333_9HELO|nr:hypothetical protein BP5796_09043 [Coleophoma crateriformis]